MFLSACRQVAKEFPDIKYDEDLLDRVCLQVRLSQSTTILGCVLRYYAGRTKPQAVCRPGHGDAQLVR